MEIICRECQIIFKVSLSELKIRNRIYCSLNCRKKNRKILFLECNHCHRHFKRYPSLVKKYTFCSKKCADLFQVGKTGPNKGRKFPQNAGENNNNWKGGITHIHKALRDSLEYEEWRKKVFERDLYTCQKSGQVGGYLHADHIKRFSDYPELRFDLNNGQTLCFDCHKIKTIEEGKIYWKNQFSEVVLWKKQ